MQSIKLYTSLIERLDIFEKKLLGALGSEISCRRGCSRCCILEGVFPVEAYNILRYMKENAGTVPSCEPDKGMCVFLNRGECSIYPCRPVICRNHGYPIFENGRVDYCPENFKETRSIDSGFILDLDALNRALVSINAIFLKENKDPSLNADRIPLADVRKRLSVSGG